VGLVGEVDRPFLDPQPLCLQLHVAGGAEGGQVGHRPAGDEEAAAVLGQPAELPQPVDRHQLDLGRTRAGEPGAEERRQAGGQGIPHGADEVARAGHEREVARMVDPHEVRQQVAPQPGEDFGVAGRPGRGRLAEQRLELLPRRLAAHRLVVQGGEMLHQQVYDPVTQVLHLLARQLKIHSVPPMPLKFRGGIS
jgi:hypothetical protein